MSSELQIEQTKFNNVAKLMLKTELSTNIDTLTGYRTQIITAYNNFVKFINSRYHAVKNNEKHILDDALVKIRQSFLKCLHQLKCTYEVPNDLFELIPENKIGQIHSQQEVITGSEPDVKDKTGNIIKSQNITEKPKSDVTKENNNLKLLLGTQTVIKNTTVGTVGTSGVSSQTVITPPKRTINMDALNLFNAVNQQFKKPYSGDPLALTTFLDGVDILSEFANTAVLQTSLLKYLKAKLDGRAREIITDDVNTITLLKQKLQANIIPENSKIIESRITSLRYAYSKQEEFASKAEELADALRRTLIIEGMTEKKANEISIDRTVQLCRKSTHSDLVKSVLASTSFKSPKEAIAKLITESDATVKEQQILRFQRFDRNNTNNARGKRGNAQNRYPNQGNRNFAENRHNNRGRGFGYRGGRGRMYNGPNRAFNNRNQNQNAYGQYNNNNANPAVRVANAGNEPGPQVPDVVLGAQAVRQFQ